MFYHCLGSINSTNLTGTREANRLSVKKSFRDKDVEKMFFIHL